MRFSRPLGERNPSTTRSCIAKEGKRKIISSGCFKPKYSKNLREHPIELRPENLVHSLEHTHSVFPIRHVQLEEPCHGCAPVRKTPDTMVITSVQLRLVLYKACNSLGTMFCVEFIHNTLRRRDVEVTTNDPCPVRGPNIIVISMHKTRRQGSNPISHTRF